MNDWLAMTQLLLGAAPISEYGDDANSKCQAHLIDLMLCRLKQVRCGVVHNYADSCVGRHRRVSGPAGRVMTRKGPAPAEKGGRTRNHESLPSAHMVSRQGTAWFTIANLHK